MVPVLIKKVQLIVHKEIFSRFPAL